MVFDRAFDCLVEGFMLTLNFYFLIDVGSWRYKRSPRPASRRRSPAGVVIIITNNTGRKKGMEEIEAERELARAIFWMKNMQRQLQVTF